MQRKINRAAFSFIGGSDKDWTSAGSNLTRLKLLELPIGKIIVWPCGREMLEMAQRNFDGGRRHPCEIAVVRSLRQGAGLVNVGRVAVNLSVLERGYGALTGMETRQDGDQDGTRQYRPEDKSDFHRFLSASQLSFHLSHASLHALI